jgi:hypothetical protein
VVAASAHSSDSDVVGNHGDWDSWMIKFATDHVGISQVISSDRNITAAFTYENNLDIAFKSNYSGNAMFTLSDVTGRIFFQSPMNVDAGGNKKEFSLPLLAAGIYFATITGKESSSSGKVVKE